MGGSLPSSFYKEVDLLGKASHVIPLVPACCFRPRLDGFPIVMHEYGLAPMCRRRTLSDLDALGKSISDVVWLPVSSTTSHGNVSSSESPPSWLCVAIEVVGLADLLLLLVLWGDLM